MAILEDRAQSRTAVSRDDACASIQHVDSSSVTVRLVFSDIFARNTFLSMDARGGKRRIEDRFLEKESTGTIFANRITIDRITIDVGTIDIGFYANKILHCC